MQVEPMTVHGYNKIVEEIKFLKEEQRPEVVKEIELAKEHGDLKENAEYHAAKEKSRIIDAKLRELGDILTRSKVIDPSILKHEKISFGSTFTIVDIDSDEESTYTIVGTTESDPDKGRISFNAPLSKSLLGKGEGDEISVSLPNGTKTYEVLGVCYKEIDFDS